MKIIREKGKIKFTCQSGEEIVFFTNQYSTEVAYYAIQERIARVQSNENRIHTTYGVFDAQIRYAKQVQETVIDFCIGEK